MSPFRNLKHLTNCSEHLVRRLYQTRFKTSGNMSQSVIINPELEDKNQHTHTRMHARTHTCKTNKNMCTSSNAINFFNFKIQRARHTHTHARL